MSLIYSDDILFFDGGGDGVCVFVCVYVCMCMRVCLSKGEREGEKEKEGEREREKSTMHWGFSVGPELHE